MFDYLYYRFFLLGKLIGHQGEPKSKAMYIFIVFQLCNLVTLIILANRIGNIITVNLTPVYGVIGAAVLIFF